MTWIRKELNKLKDEETRFAQIMEWLAHPVSVILVASGLLFLLAPTSDLIIINWWSILLLGILGIISIVLLIILIKILPHKEDLEGEQYGIKKYFKIAIDTGERTDLATGIIGSIDIIILFIVVFIFKYPMPEVYIFASATLTVVMGTLAVIRYFWKISVHCGISSLVITSFTLWRFWQFVWLYLFLLPIIYSRLKLKRHTLSQTIAGILIGVLIPAGLYFFVYLNPELLANIQKLYVT
ncbi:MAG: hypothetical protein EAX96_03940 [Candidatus Lokiarchaeota archaeon]|nr:hypothetical protein [Candidatus Lokiarchaeota archaeon]